MGLLDAILGKKKKPTTHTQAEIYSLGNSFFTKGSVFDSEVFMSAVYAHSRHFSQITPKHYLKEKAIDDKLTRLLSLRPNPLMSASAFWEKVAIEYYTVNNVFIYLEYDALYSLQALWILDPSQTMVQVHNTGDIYLRFNLNSKELIAHIDEVVHIPRNCSTSEFFGDDNGSIVRVLNLIETNYKGIENAIKTAAYLRFLIKTVTPLSDPEKRRRVEQFAKDYMDSTNSVGVGYLDNASDVIKLDSQAKYANKEEMTLFEDKVNKYLGVPQCILNNSFTEDEWQSYYKGAAVPLIKKISDELTYKLFTDNELTRGNAIKIELDQLNYASLSSRTKLVAQTKEIGILTVNEQRRLLGLEAIKDGDQIRQVSLNFVQAEKQNKYQEVEEVPDGNDEKDV